MGAGRRCAGKGQKPRGRDRRTVESFVGSRQIGGEIGGRGGGHGKGGGGRPDMAQAGGPDIAKTEAGIDAMRALIQDAV